MLIWTVHTVLWGREKGATVKRQPDAAQECCRTLTRRVNPINDNSEYSVGRHACVFAQNWTFRPKQSAFCTQVVHHCRLRQSWGSAAVLIPKSQVSQKCEIFAASRCLNGTVCCFSLFWIIVTYTSFGGFFWLLIGKNEQFKYVKRLTEKIIEQLFS